ncbi:MAG: hypothetical protein ACREA9_04455, partial [Pyrinomonadaceae bacterium]
NNTVIKVDCIVLKSDAFRQGEFARRRQITLGDFQTWIVSREDLILSKLNWAKESHSELQLRDVRSLLESEVDVNYLRTHAKTLGVADSLNGVLPDNE